MLSTMRVSDEGGGELRRVQDGTNIFRVNVPSDGDSYCEVLTLFFLNFELLIVTRLIQPLTRFTQP